MRLNEKLKELKRYLTELQSFAPVSLEEYKRSLKDKAVAERYFEKIVECATDVAILVIKENSLETPRDDREAFELLQKNKIISLETAEAMQHAKSMRNHIAHQYGDIDDTTVFEAITRELPRDITKFIKEVENSI